MFKFIKSSPWIYLETANVQKNDFQQHNDGEIIEDPIEARLRAKHHLRESVHQHTDDDKYENEQDCKIINFIF